MQNLTITISTSAETHPSLNPFNFDGHAVRIEIIGGKPWFAVADVCDVLGYANSRKALADHCRTHGVTKRDTIDSMGRTQPLTYINQGNLYRLIARSKKPEAERFETWVFDEVLPSIFNTGGYIAPAKAPVQRISERDLCLLKNYLQSSTKTTLRARSNYERLLNYLCVRFGVERLEHLPASEVVAANAEARRVDSQIAELRGLLVELEHEAFTGYLTQSAPLIRSLKRKYKPELERIAGNPLNIRKLIAEDYLSTVSLSA